MSYARDTGEVSARYYPPSEVEQVTIGAGTLARFVATGKETEGRFGLYEWNMPANTGGAGAHFHKTFSESFYTMEGEIELYDGDQWVKTSPGDFLYVPPGGIHGFRNESDEPARMLILFAPGAPREAYFRELVEIGTSGRTLSEDEWTDLYARHDQYRAT